MTLSGRIVAVVVGVLVFLAAGELVVRLLGYQGDEPVLQVGDDRINQLDRLTLLVTEGRPLELLAPHRLALEDAPAEVPSVDEKTSDLSTEG